ncbi:MAG TPA: glycogen debranching enzyme N-terminal domain-containing protein, partial [Candidatus Limnocylindrales bacterium]|nr:glycogen debranching enzyme N-terminal domain-containing protein [Candidatus Limnocylindrales bacterium]
MADATDAPRPAPGSADPAAWTDCTPVVVRLGPEICRDTAAALRREWLVTNGLGGYAFGTVAGAPTRAYHGLLVAALRPPVERTVLVAGLEERVATPDGGDPVRLIGGRDGTLVEFRLEGMLPVWTHAAADGMIERRVWADHGVNATSVRYELCDGARPVRLSVVPLVTARDHHDPRPRRGNTRPSVRLLTPRHATVRLVTPVGPIDLHIRADQGSLRTDGPGLGRWRRRIPLPEEPARGL